MGLDMNRCRLVRLRVPLSVADPAAKVTTEALCPPEAHGNLLLGVSIDPRRAGRSYRYVYGICITSPRPCNSMTGVCRVDVTDGSVVTWSESPRAVPAGPPKFLPRPGAHPDDETDGVLLVDCLGADGAAFYVVLDGRTLAEVARVGVPFRHCVSFNSAWIWGSFGRAAAA